MLHCGGDGLSEVGLFSRSITSARTHMFQFSRKLSCPRVLHRATVFVTLGGYREGVHQRWLFQVAALSQKSHTSPWNLCWDLGLGTMLVTQKLQQSFRIGYESSSRTDGDCLRPRRVVLQKSYRSCRTAEPGRARNC